MRSCETRILPRGHGNIYASSRRSGSRRLLGLGHAQSGRGLSRPECAGFGFGFALGAGSGDGAQEASVCCLEVGGLGLGKRRRSGCLARIVQGWNNFGMPDSGSASAGDRRVPVWLNQPFFLLLILCLFFFLNSFVIVDEIQSRAKPARGS